MSKSNLRVTFSMEYDEAKGMKELLTNEQAKDALEEGKKLSHPYFTKDEWVKGSGGAYVFEDGCRCSPHEFWSCRDFFPSLWTVIE
ncbi:hypothetical protein MX350_003787 [Vibrio parahaemolyticus]|nr:hypothetical protein [Vibrio parahaemolyticus]EJG0937098.1 hypothetical protein [Vibrio parahaemolyticus]